MPLLPPRRWFQFRLTTWFVLVAILAWAMICRPWVVTKYILAPNSASIAARGRPASVRFVLTNPKRRPFGGGGLARFTLTRPMIETQSLNPSLLYPALALTAFVGCKAAWAVGRRAKERNSKSSAPGDPDSAYELELRSLLDLESKEAAACDAREKFKLTDRVRCQRLLVERLKVAREAANLD